MGHVEFDFGKYIDLIQAWLKGILSHYTETNTYLANCPDYTLVEIVNLTFL